MKKLIYLPLLLLTLVVGVNKVNAVTTTSSNLYKWYDQYGFNVDIATNYTTVVDNLKTYWNANLSSQYPYYMIYTSNVVFEDTLAYIDLVACDNYFLHASRDTNSGDAKFVLQDNMSCSTYRYSVSDTSYSLTSGFNTWLQHLPYYTNHDFIFKYNSSYYNPIEFLTIPSWSDLTFDVAFPLTYLYDGDTIPTYISLTNGEPTADFTQVDMSDYDYIILSLKDYDIEPFNTTIYSLGRLCFTPVYDYGMTQKQSMYAGYQTAGCTEYYNSSTPVMIFIIQADIDNHAVYYIKRYNDETNILNIPTSIFDITYITPSNASDPQVEIGGRSYPALPYSDLSDTANKSSEEGYISGRVCSLGDVNCQASATGMDISDLFTQPLKLLQSLWTSITSVFSIITTFITILPPTLQTFLYVSFMLGIVIGIIKILL